MAAGFKIYSSDLNTEPVCHVLIRVADQATDGSGGSDQGCSGALGNTVVPWQTHHWRLKWVLRCMNFNYDWLKLEQRSRRSSPWASRTAAVTGCGRATAGRVAILQPCRELTSVFLWLRLHIKRQRWVLLVRSVGLVEGGATCSDAAMVRGGGQGFVKFFAKLEHGTHLYIGILLSNHSQQGYDLDPISNLKLNSRSEKIWLKGRFWWLWFEDELDPIMGA
jgi:hypothetical protein